MTEIHGFIVLMIGLSLIIFCEGKPVLGSTARRQLSGEAYICDSECLIAALQFG